jgi:hypothetical protein
MTIATEGCWDMAYYRPTSCDTFTERMMTPNPLVALAAARIIGKPARTRAGAELASATK